MKLFLDFHFYLYLFISIFMHLYLYFKEKNLKPCKMFIYVICMYACVYKFHSLKAMQHFQLCRHVCMYIYVSQGDFRQLSFTAGRCGTPLIPNDQFRSLRRNGVRSSDLIPNDQLRRNGVRSSDLIVSVSK